jgi:aminodeoxyfutalosine synthase
LSTAGGFRALAPLPRQLSSASPTTGYDDVKAVALARLLLPDVPSIQVDWPLYGPKLAQVGLIVGADDIDGVLALDGGALGARRSALEEVRGNIRAAGLSAAERNGRFERIGRASE